MSASEKLAALQQAVLTPPGEDDDYAEIVLEHERGSSGFNAAGAEAAKTVLNALLALVALVDGAASQYPCCHECAIGANELPSTTQGRALLGYLVYSPLIEDITHAELALVIEHIRRIEYGR
jgi:hypothetical protein